MPGHRPGYWPRMACFNFVTSQFSAGSCARRLCRKMHSVNSGYATGGASARSAYCACQRCASPCGTVANSGRVVSSRGKVEKFCVAAHAPRESLAGELAVNFTVAGFAIGHHHVFPGDKVAHRQRTAAGDLLRRPQGGDSHGHHRLADDLPTALFVDRHRDINALLLQQLANLEGVGGYRLQ